MLKMNTVITSSLSRQHKFPIYDEHQVNKSRSGFQGETHTELVN